MVTSAVYATKNARAVHARTVSPCFFILPKVSAAIHANGLF